MWWDEKKAGLRLKSTPIEPTPGPIDELLPPEDHIDWDGGMTKVEGEEDVMEVDEGAKCGDDEDENMTHLEKFAVERFRPDGTTPSLPSLSDYSRSGLRVGQGFRRTRG